MARICILNVSFEGSRSSRSTLDPLQNPEPYLPEHNYTRKFIRYRYERQEVEALAHQGYDCFINLCDGGSDEDLAGIEVVESLEALGLPFTGSKSFCYDPTRQQMKTASQQAGLLTADHWFATNLEDARTYYNSVPFPVIVKHPHGYNSEGITQHSVVSDFQNLERQVEIALKKYGSVLFEAFIPGREFTVLVAENADGFESPLVYQPVEFEFPEGETFKHFDLKWKGYQQLRCKPVENIELNQQLQLISRAYFQAMKASGYGRIDFRMDGRGNIYILEINPNCSIFYPPEDAGSADFILLNDPAGHRGFLQNQLKLAALRGK